MKQKKYYGIGEAAKKVGSTIETLRYYNRIDLLKPAKIDSKTNYRYYTDTELIYLEVIAFCKRNKMSLTEIKKLMNADFTEIISFLQSTEQNIDAEINHLYRTKEQIYSLRQSLQNNCSDYSSCPYTKVLEQRAIFTAEHLQDASLENFQILHNEIYQELGVSEKEKFLFDQSANFLAIPSHNGMLLNMFAVCTKYSGHPALKFLEAGEYLCCKCMEKNRDEAVFGLLYTAREKYHVNPQNVILHVEFIGLFQWQYEIQIFINNNKNK